MKRVLTISMAAALALPLFAEEPKRQPEKKAVHTQQEPAETQQDSPMVAAAKRSKRSGKTSPIVITNATLKDYHANARVTTTTSERSLNVPEPVPPRDAPVAKVIAPKTAETKQAGAANSGAAGAETPRSAEGEDLDFNPGDRELDPARAEKIWRDAQQAFETDPDLAEQMLREAYGLEEEEPPH